mgnify:CR=1 FL=1
MVEGGSGTGEDKGKGSPSTIARYAKVTLPVPTTTDHLDAGKEHYDKYVRGPCLAAG